MRTGPNKRSRGRNNNNNSGGGGGGMMNGQHGRPRPPHRQQTFDSNGPGIKIRGNAYQVFERYVALAREAASAGDRVAAENLYQHAEHYFRIINAMNQAVQQTQQGGQQHGQRRFGDSDAPGEPGEEPRSEDRMETRPDGRSYDTRGRGQEGEEGPRRGQSRHEPRGEGRMESRQEHRPAGIGDQPDAREIPIAALPPEG